MSLELFKKVDSLLRQFTELIENHERRLTNLETDVKAIGKHLILKEGNNGKEACSK